MNEAISTAPVIFLTGAGASASLGLHTTARFVGEFEGVFDHNSVASMKSICPRDPDMAGEEPDFEVLLSHAKRCIEAFSVLKVDPFCLPIVGEDYDVPPLSTMVERIHFYERFVEEGCNAVIKYYGEVDGAEATELYKPLLIATFGNGNRSGRVIDTLTVPIFTLNYDPAIERACENLEGEVRVVDGFSREINSVWSRDRFDNYKEKKLPTVVLFKLHGSADWCRDAEEKIHKRPGLYRDPPPMKHSVLYPLLDQKGWNEEPFRTGFEYLESCLERAQKVVVMGTSLRDPEIRRLLGSAFRKRNKLSLYYVSLDKNADWVAEKLDIPSAQLNALCGKLNAVSMTECSTRIWEPVTGQTIHLESGQDEDEHCGDMEGSYGRQ